MANVAIVVADDYNTKIPNAYHTVISGYYRGFASAGCHVIQVRRSDMGTLGDGWILWMTHDDFGYLNGAAMEAVRNNTTIVHVAGWFDGMKNLYSGTLAPTTELPERTRQMIIDAKPAFVWGSAPEAYLSYWKKWSDAGLRVLSFPWAFDERDDVEDKQFYVDMAFIGGYRVYKKAQYDAYLWPYKNRLKIWGYTPWPMCYQGVLPERDEYAMYKSAKVCPSISEPPFATTGNTVQRPFRILGAGGLAVFDCVPAYKKLFTSDEALIPDNEREYHQMVEQASNDPAFNERYRRAGYKAVMERHTYRHRVTAMLEALQ